MKIKKRMKKIICLFLFLLICSIQIRCNAKYILDYKLDAISLDIDRTKPQITVEAIQNTNTNYSSYASNIHTITLNVKVKEKNMGNDTIDANEIEVLVGSGKVNASKSIKILSKTGEEAKYEIKLTNITGNGLLQVKFIEGTITDTAGWKSGQLQTNTKIQIDNTAPTGTFVENVISQGKVNAEITCNEKIRPIEGWTITSEQNKITKEFASNIIYDLPIIDYAQNTSKVNVKISKATNIKLIYASHNSQIGWTFGYGNYDVAGKTAVKTDPSYKTEALAFRIEGNVPTDFVRARSYIYTHWGEGSKAKCKTSGLVYSYGYNPSTTGWKSMASNDLVTIDGKKYFQFGGSYINGELQTDINGNNPIPIPVAYQHPYGICGINLWLKDTSYYSIIYQILVDKVGWLTPCSDGKECMYQKTKPMSAIRVALVPKTEKKYVLEKWNKDIGTMNVDN